MPMLMASVVTGDVREPLGGIDADVRKLIVGVITVLIFYFAKEKLTDDRIGTVESDVKVLKSEQTEDQLIQSGFVTEVHRQLDRIENDIAEMRKEHRR